MPIKALSALIVTGVTLAACSSSGGSATTPGASPSKSPAAGQREFGAGAGGAAASGRIAEIDGNTLQVQSTTDQTAVKVTAATAYTERAKTSLAAVKVGTCVVAVAASSTSTASASAAPPTAITATTVDVIPPVRGSCTRGFGGGPARPSGFPSRSRPGGLPSNFPTSRPSGARGRFSAFGSAVTGKVTAVSGSTITVAVTRRSATASAAPTASAATVRTSPATTYFHTIAARRSALRVGLCAQAFGKTDSTGAVSASRISLSPATNGQCQTGFLGGPR